MKGRTAFLVAVLLMIWFGLSTAGYTATDEELLKTRREVEANLICQCGCIMIVVDCDCSNAEQIRADITAKLQQGQSKNEIIDSYVAVYGKKVLAAPPKKGFDLTAWITPFLAILAAAVIIYFVVRRWVLHYQGFRIRSSDEEEVSPEDKARYEGKLEDELRKYF